MADAKEKTIALLSSTDSVDMKTAGATTLYTVPAGKTCLVTQVVIRNTTASLAGGTDYDFGKSGSHTEFKQTVDLSGGTTSGTSYYVVTNNNAWPTVLAAGEVFQINVVTGSTAACTATVEVFGYLV